MSRSSIGKWKKNLAIRVPIDVTLACGLAVGETVDIDVRDGDLIVRRLAAHVQVRQDAEAAAAEIIADSRYHSLGDVSIQKLIEEGRRG